MDDIQKTSSCNFLENDHIFSIGNELCKVAMNWKIQIAIKGDLISWKTEWIQQQNLPRSVLTQMCFCYYISISSLSEVCFFASISQMNSSICICLRNQSFSIQSGATIPLQAKRTLHRPWQQTQAQSSGAHRVVCGIETSILFLCKGRV